MLGVFFFTRIKKQNKSHQTRIKKKKVFLEGPITIAACIIIYFCIIHLSLKINLKYTKAVTFPFPSFYQYNSLRKQAVLTHLFKKRKQKIKTNKKENKASKQKNLIKMYFKLKLKRE